MASQTTIVYLKPCKLAVVRADGPYRVSEKNAWTELFEWLDSGQHHEPNGMGFGLSYCNATPDGESTAKYIAGVRIPKSWNERDWDSMQVHDFGGGAYMVRENIASYDHMANVITDIEDQWDSRASLYWDVTRPVLSIYRHDPRSTPYEQQQADVCLPIGSERRRVVRAS